MCGRLAPNSAVESWIYQVALSHSGSKSTEKRYRLSFELFCLSAGRIAEEIIEDYEKLPEKTFKRIYAQAIMSHIAELKEKKRSSGSLATTLNAIRSFFKYNSLPLNFMPTVRVDVENHNRDIEKEEIAEIIRNAEYRERAFFILIAQTGLRPDTLTRLKIRDIENILESYTPTPCLIRVGKDATKGKYHEYFTFAPKESVTYLKEYLKTRKTPINEDSYVFVMCEDESKPARPGVFSHLFRRIVMKLQDRKVLVFKTNRKEMSIESKDHKVLRNCVTRNELRLYNLRKFFRKYAGQAGGDFVNFWMGHTSALGVDLTYFSKDIEHHRKQYKDKAMPHLTIETHMPTDTGKTIDELKKQLREKDAKVEDLSREVNEFKKLLPEISKLVELSKEVRELREKVDLSEQERREKFSHIQTIEERQVENERVEAIIQDHIKRTGKDPRNEDPEISRQLEELGLKDQKQTEQEIDADNQRVEAMVKEYDEAKRKAKAVKLQDEIDN
jgi:integrase